MRISALPIAALLWALAVSPAGAQPPKKQVKDQAEQELYNQSIQSGDSAAQIQALQAWTARYADSDFKDDRLYFFLQAYDKANPPQPAKVLEYGAVLMARDLRAVFPGADGGLVILNILFLTARNAAALSDASPDQLALGRRAAHDLLQFVATFRPPNTGDAEWNTARADIELRTRATLLALSLAPGNQAMRKSPPDCGAAATHYLKTMEEFPADAGGVYSLAKALQCQGRMPEAIFQFVRAGEMQPGEIADYARKLYAAYHGSPEGFDAVCELAKRSPLPPEDFRIEPAADAADRRQSEFARNHPETARWNSIRGNLLASYGPQYFEGQVKGEALALKGTVVEGRPACRPKELLVKIGSAEQSEIVLRLDSPLAGAFVAGEIEFTAVPRHFTREPFTVMMSAERAKIGNLKVGACQ